MSSPGASYGWLEIVLSALVALGFGGYQLWAVNREIRRDRERGPGKDDPSG